MTPADEHRSIAGTFGDRVRGVPAGGWDSQSPVPQWRARDVVRHLVEWFPPFLNNGSGVLLPVGPSVDVDPVGAWETQCDAVQALLDDRDTARRVFRDRHLGEMPLDRAVSTFYTADVFLHTWDLARATGQDERLDAARCQAMYEAMLPLDAALRASGQYGPRVDVPADADAQTRLLGLIGRTP